MQVAFVLKTLYDTDVIDEEVIVAWYDKASAASILDVPAPAAKAVRDVAKQFVDWLKQYADDSEEDDEEEGEEEEDEEEEEDI